MSDNIDALGEKLSPENLKRQAQDVVSEKAHEVVANVEERARQTGDRLVEFIRNNPLPVAAVSIGALWLFTQRNRSEISGDRMARFAHTGPERRSRSGISERAGELASSAQHRAEELGGVTADRAHQLTERAREQARRARSGLDRRMSDNPVVVAAGAVILGAAIGMLLPRTEPEHRLMGSASDAVLDRAHEVAEQVKDAAMEAGGEVKEAVREQVAERGPDVKNLVKDAAGVVGEQLKESVDRMGDEAKRTVGLQSDPGTA